MSLCTFYRVFEKVQGYPGLSLKKDITRRWTEKREMNAVVVAREARDEGKKDLERVNRQVEQVNREVERVNREVERRYLVRPYLSLASL